MFKLSTRFLALFAIAIPCLLAIDKIKKYLRKYQP